MPTNKELEKQIKDLTTVVSQIASLLQANVTAKPTVNLENMVQTAQPTVKPVQSENMVQTVKHSAFPIALTLTWTKPYVHKVTGWNRARVYKINNEPFKDFKYRNLEYEGQLYDINPILPCSKIGCNELRHQNRQWCLDHSTQASDAYLQTRNTEENRRPVTKLKV